LNNEIEFEIPTEAGLLTTEAWQELGGKTQAERALEHEQGVKVCQQTWILSFWSQ